LKNSPNFRYLLMSVGLFVVFALVGYYATTSSSYTDVSDLVKMKPGVYLVRGDVVRWWVTQDREYLIIELAGKRGDQVTAKVPVSYIEKKYGPLSQVIITNGEMVVKGYWDGRVLHVQDILKGCHSAYQQPAVNS